MDEICLELDLQDLRALLNGRTLVYSPPPGGEGPTFMITCGPETISQLKGAVQAALVSIMPGAPGVH